MSVLFIVVPLALLIAGGAVLAFVWGVKGGQFDDLETPALRVALDDDEGDVVPEPKHDDPPGTGSA